MNFMIYIYIYIYCPHLYCQVHRPRNVGIDKPRGEIEKNIDTTKIYTYVHIYILGGDSQKGAIFRAAASLNTNPTELKIFLFHSFCAHEAMLLYSSKLPQIGKITSDGDSLRTLQVTPAHSVSSFKTTI